MTVRAILLGLVAALFIATYGYVVHHVLRLEPVESGHLLPVGVIGGLMLLVVLLNPLLFRIRRSAALRPSEFAVACMMMLIACSLPGRGLMEQFTTSLAMPTHWNRIEPGWQRSGLLDYAPSRMLANDKRDDPEVIQAFVVGSGGRQHWNPLHWMPIGDVPWSAWTRTMSTWLPLLMLSATAVICLGLIVHRQWTDHEQLPYPIARFTASLLEREPDRMLGPLFRSRGFWIGLGIVCFIRVWNGMCLWYDDWMTPIRLTFDLQPLTTLWPDIQQTPWGTRLFQPTIYPIVIGFSFFLASEVALSVGISQFLFVPLAAVLVGYGVDMHSSYMAGGAMGWHRAGAYVAFTLIVGYVGRRYYGQVLRSALRGRAADDVETHVTWACRILVVALIAMTVMMINLGLDWPIAVLTVALIMVVFVGVSRISAETGLFFIQARWQPLGVCLGLFGYYALGPQELVIVGLLSVVLCLDPSQAVMPYFVNALRMCQIVRVKLVQVAWSSWVTYGLCLLVAVVFVLWAQYHFGAPRGGWSFRRVPTMTFRPAAVAVDELTAQGRLAQSEALTPLQRLGSMRPRGPFVWWFTTGFVLVMLTSAARMRFPRWPLHPVVFLLWSTYPIAALHHSFLLGWLLKSAVVRFGGQGWYHRCKPFMTGIIAGEVASALIFMVVGVVYYAIFQQAPVPYRVLPR